MKRSMREVVGLPRSDDYRQDVAGVPPVARRLDVASFRHVFDDPMEMAATDERGELPEPDPLFRERLHRRLWRTHVIMNLRDGGETH